MVIRAESQHHVNGLSKQMRPSVRNTVDHNTGIGSERRRLSWCSRTEGKHFNAARGTEKDLLFILGVNKVSAVAVHSDDNGKPDQPYDLLVSNSTYKSFTVCWTHAYDKGLERSFPLLYRSAGQQDVYTAVAVSATHVTCVHFHCMTLASQKNELTTVLFETSNHQF
ncbi:hypothetical protein BaRGS_00013402 [Batillaria attramentaria]|uniref:Uncharacterized protein n=1 Tax=Batillaria attramentaria TaxID=370345 RepID=A0ABD0L8H7_9CAEN